MKYQTGQLLVATPELVDSNFFRTVSLIFHHDEEGAAGVIINRPTELTIGESWEELAKEPLSGLPLHDGGPVEGPLIALHNYPIYGETQIISGVFMSMSKTNILKLVGREHEPIKVFSGYAGWGAGQLEMEMEHGGWLTFPCQTVDIFETPEEIWKNVCSKIGNEIMLSKDQSRQANEIDPLAN